MVDNPKSVWFALPLLVIAALLGGCSASVGTFETSNSFNEALLKDSESDVAAEFSKKPAAQFPTHIAVARLAGDEERDAHRYYYQRSNRGTGAIDFSDTSKHGQVVEIIGKQPGVAGAGAINSLLVPPSEENALRAIRKAAARIHADMVLVYVVNSGRNVDDEFPLLTLVTLGLAPVQKLDAGSSVAAALIDVRTGYIYGVLNATSEETGRTIGWGSSSASKSLRKETETAVMDKFIASIPASWKSVESRYAGKPAPAEVVVEPETAKSASK